MAERVYIVGAGQMGLVMAYAAVEAGVDKGVLWGPYRSGAKVR